MKLNIEIPEKIFVIAEIGINHNGSLKTAKELIDVAKRCGCDAVKFQKRDIDTVYTKEELEKLRESPWGKTQREQKSGLEFSEKEYDEIDKYCKDQQIEWFASAWDIKSLDFLKKYKLNHNKVASALITHKNFLEHCAKQKIHTFISTGMSNMKMIEQAVEVFSNNSCPFSLMHSVSLYPCPSEVLNLNNIVLLKNKFNCSVGYSGHEASVSPSIVAAALGATCIERHITLDRSMYGSDQSASLEEPGLRNLVNSIRKVRECVGVSDKKIQIGEESVAKKLRYWES
jgi:N-acetylneuraminate synthase